MQAKIKIDLDRRIGEINPNIYGHFMSRRPGCSEGGLYDPESSVADEDGLRSDVVSWIQATRPPLMRWPGGCTGTSYHWLDGVGPVAERPRKIDLHFGWEARYEFGTDEFIAFCRRIGAEPHMNWAMGTATLDEAAGWLEYCNSRFNTYYANLRRKYGNEEPFNVKYWQLGNEMYGPWEIGYSTPQAYAVEAREWAKTLRRVDPSIQMIAVGGGNEEAILANWAWEVAPEVGPYVDYLSFHTYWHPSGLGDPYYEILAGPYRAENMIDTLHSIIKLTERARRNSRKLSIACTEWNVAPPGGMMANHPVLNPFGSTYNLRDALAVASFINIMQRRCREVTLATVAQSINVVGLIMVDNQDHAWREPVYYPLLMQVQHSGPVTLDTLVETQDTFDEPNYAAAYESSQFSRWASRAKPETAIPYLDSSTTFDPDAGKVYISLVNLHHDDALEVAIDLRGANVKGTGAVHTLYHDDVDAMNTPEQPDNVVAATARYDQFKSAFVWELKPHSYTILELDLQ